MCLSFPLHDCMYTLFVGHKYLHFPTGHHSTGAAKTGAPLELVLFQQESIKGTERWS